MPKLTKSLIDLLPAKEAEYEVHDSSLSGFRVRVQPSGQKSFVVVYRSGRGRTAPQRRKTIGRSNQISAEQARNEAARLLAAARLGDESLATFAGSHHGPSMGDVFDRFLAEHVRPKLKPRTQQEYSRMVNLHLRPRLGRLRVEEVRARHVQELHHSMRATPRLANHLVAVLSKVMDLAEKWSLRDGVPNPCRGLVKYPERSRERLLSKDEMQRIRAVLQADACHPTIVLAISFLMLTGSRSVEICTLRWADVDFDRGEFTLSNSKTGTLVKPLSAAVRVLLQDWITHGADRWVCPPLSGGSGHLHPRVLRSEWARVLRQAGVTHTGIHALRHWFCSGVYSNPHISMPTAMKIVGHQSVQTALRYHHMAAADLINVADKAIKRLFD